MTAVTTFPRWIAPAVTLTLAVALVSVRMLASDPRDAQAVESIHRQRESDAFRDRLRNGQTRPFAWPGLAAAQVSWTWLEVLSGLHAPESYEGDFSWIFSKLETIVQVSHPREIDFLSTLAPFYFVIGHDYAGATLIMNDMIQRAGPRRWRPWFWAGFHALENLNDRRLAGDLFARAAMDPASPPFLAPLSVRLSLGNEFLRSAEKRQLLENGIAPELREKILQARPEWLKD